MSQRKKLNQSLNTWTLLVGRIIFGLFMGFAGNTQKHSCNEYPQLYPLTLL